MVVFVATHHYPQSATPRLPAIPSDPSVPHVSSVPDREFDRPTTIDELRRLSYLGTEIIFRAILYVGYEQEQDDAWQILHRLHLEISSAHAFICVGESVGLANREKAGAA
jgi:hypothetical protein